MTKIKIISMDFDGTLLTSQKTITDRTKKCIQNLQSKSYIIIGITARNLLSVKNVLDVNLFDYIILNNGSDIYYVKEDKVESISQIKNDIIKEIYNLCDKKASQIDFCGSHKYFIKTNNKSDDRPFIKYISNLDEVDNSVSRMNVFFDNLDELEDNRKVIENISSNINVIKMLNTDNNDSRIWLTINPKEANKLETLKKLCDYLKCTIDEVVFFGDGENDLILIENAGIGVAMDNAIESVKEKASFITLSNDNDGVAEYLENNLL